MVIEIGFNTLTNWTIGLAYVPGEDLEGDEFQEFEIGLGFFYISFKVYV
jgi:hypothetical protein